MSFLSRDFSTSPVETNPTSSAVVPVFGGESPASYSSSYVPSYATRWVEALQTEMTLIFVDIQNAFSDVVSRVVDLENNVAGYQDAGEVGQSINNALVGFASEAYVSTQLGSYDTSSQVDSKITAATTGLASSSGVQSAIDASLEDYDDSEAVDGKITTAINNLVNGAPSNLDTLNELAAAYNAADSTLQGLIDANTGDLSDATARITALEQLVNDLHTTVYGE
jgi:hypothetical protein